MIYYFVCGDRGEENIGKVGKGIGKYENGREKDLKRVRKGS